MSTGLRMTEWNSVYEKIKGRIDRVMSGIIVSSREINLHETLLFTQYFGKCSGTFQIAVCLNDSDIVTGDVAFLKLL